MWDLGLLTQSNPGIPSPRLTALHAPPRAPQTSQRPRTWVDLGGSRVLARELLTSRRAGCARLRPDRGSGRSPRMTTPTSMAAANSDAHAPVLTADLLVTLKQAADLCNLHWETVKDNRLKGRYPNAVQDKTGLKTWHIPVGDLVAAGHLDPASLAEVAPRIAAVRESREVASLRAEIADLRVAVAVAEARAEERQVLVDTLRTVLAASVPGLAGASREVSA